MRPACILLVVLLLGCGTTLPLWRAPIEMRAPDDEVAAALGDSYRGPTPVVDPAPALEPPEPTSVRPCCAFGDDFKIVYGVVPIPGYELHNMRGLEDVGLHKYNVGLLGLKRENNGLV